MLAVYMVRDGLLWLLAGLKVYPNFGSLDDYLRIKYY